LLRRRKNKGHARACPFIFFQHLVIPTREAEGGARRNLLFADREEKQVSRRVRSSE
jgi:hypothetical protein